MQRPVFKNTQGGWITKGLFWETQLPENRQYVAFTLKQEPHEGFPSLYQMFLESTELDETEYHFATKVLGGWEHWKALQACDWFKPYLNSWREEVAVRERAKNLVKIKTIAEQDDNKGQLQANRFLLEKGWKEKDSAGRPSKEKIKQEAQKLMDQETVLDEDYERILGERLN